MSNNGTVEHRKDYFYLEFREEYLIICMNCKYKKPVKDGAKCKASPHCKALILAILERWTDDKRKKGEDLAIYMTYPMWIDSMYGMFGRNVIIDSLDELLGEGLISRDKHKMYGKETYKYLLNYKEINRRIKLLPQSKAFTSKRDETNDAFTNQSDAFTSKPDTRLLVNDDAFTKGRNIESNIDSNNIDSERKNDEPDNVAQPEESFSHSINQSSSVSQQETKPEEVVFSAEEQAVYELAEKLNLVYLKKDTNHKESCSKLVEKGVTTQEKMESLIQHCRQVPFLQGKTLNLKNLVNELAGWLQLQRKTTMAPSSSTITSARGKATAEWMVKEEEVKRRIAEQEAARVGPRPSLQEIKKKLQKEKMEKSRLEYEAALARGEDPL